MPRVPKPETIRSQHVRWRRAAIDALAGRPIPQIDPEHMQVIALHVMRAVMDDVLKYDDGEHGLLGPSLPGLEVVGPIDRRQQGMVPFAPSGAESTT